MHVWTEKLAAHPERAPTRNAVLASRFFGHGSSVVRLEDAFDDSDVLLPISVDMTLDRYESPAS